MYIIHVIPLTKLPLSNDQVLEYFSMTAVLPGSIVSVSLNNRVVLAIVFRTVSARNKKAQIKGSRFQLKKIIAVISDPLYTPQELELLYLFHKYYAESLGLFAQAKVPDYILKMKSVERQKEFLHHLALPPEYIPAEPMDEKTELPISCYQEPRSRDRYAYYMQCSEETVRHSRGVIIFVPEIIRSYEVAAYFIDHRSAALQNTPLLQLSGKTAKKTQYEIVRTTATSTNFIVITTKIGIHLPLHNVGLIIEEDEPNTAHFSFDQHPYYSVTASNILIAQKLRIPVIFGGNTVSVSTRYFCTENHLPLHTPIADMRAPWHIVDMRAHTSADAILAPPVAEALQQSIQENKRALLFIDRIGYSTFLFCPDCGAVESCPHCGTPLVYHSEGTMLVCHKCAYTKKPVIACSACNSPRIRYYGKGSEKLEQQIKKLLPPTTPVIRLDSAALPKIADQERAWHEFAEHIGTVLIASPAALKFITAAPQPVTLGMGAVVSIDTLLNLPDYSMPEELYTTLRRLEQFFTAALQHTKPYIQTYKPESDALHKALTVDDQTFSTDQWAQRKAFNFPPFSDMIQIIITGRSASHAERLAQQLSATLHTASKRMQKLAEKQSIVLTLTIIPPHPAFIPLRRGNYVYEVLVLFASGYSPYSREHIRWRDLFIRQIPYAKEITLFINPPHIITH